MGYSKTKTSFYRRLYIAYLIDQGFNTVPAIMGVTGMPRRTAQDTITSLKEEVLIVDYVDSKVPMLARMFEKRRGGYRAMGYQEEEINLLRTPKIV